jgi:large subunit ribosomal protein L3
MIGLIGKKIGMTQVFDDGGNLIPVTAIRVEPNVVVGHRTIDKHGYSATVLASLPVKKKRLTKPVAGQFVEGVEPRRIQREVRDFDRELGVGDEVGAEIFEGILFVDVQGLSKGKGYQGVIRRHGFRGGRKTHGSKFHRANGSTGMAAWPSKVHRGTKMPGRMGGDRRTVQNLRLVGVDAERQLLLVRGSVPGTRDSLVIVREARKKQD